MTTRKSMLVFLGILVASVVLGPAIKVDAETMNYKFYTWAIKHDEIAVEDVEGHTFGFGTRGALYIFENGEIANVNVVLSTDMVKMLGPFMQYVTIKFQDGSTIIIKSQGKFGGGAADWKSEIIKGTGRFQGAKGTQSAKAKYLPMQKGEPGPRGYGEGTITYTLPSK